MFQKLISFIFRSRHYWRNVSFDEVAELYTSRTLMMFALNFVNLFAAVYLYNLGYTVQFILSLYGAVYLLSGLLCSGIAAKYVAYYGPKHAMLASNIIRAVAMTLFALAPIFGINAVIGFVGLQAIATVLYGIGYYVGFSKVKNDMHAGKEIGTMQILERMARLLSPLLGGVVASLFGPYVAVVIAGLLLVASSIPLFLTVEPTKLRGKLEMGGFPWRASLPSLAGQFVFGYEWIVGGMVWTLFVSIFIFDALGQNVYAVLGGLSSIGILASIVVAWGIGKAVDRHKGGILLAMGAVASSVIHLFRPFVITPAGAAATNIASESSVSAYGMPLMRVMFDVADSSGHRIAYCMFVELSITLGIAAACGLGALLVGLMGEMHGLQSSFLIAAVVELILLVLVRRVR